MDARALPDVMVFLEVVRAGSITQAAKRLHMVQSNVTARIKKLEALAGTPLLRRHARGVKPTPAGEAAVALALRVDAVIDDLRFTFGRGASARGGKLRVGAIETVLASHLPPVVAGFLREFPAVDVSVRTGSSTALLRQLKDGELDAAFVSRAPGLAGFRERLAFRDELVVVAPVSAARSLRTWLTPGPALTILVQRLGCSYTERLLTLLAARSRRPYRLLELGTLEGMLGFIELGLGLAVMPRAFVASAGSKRALALLDLPPPLRALKTYLVAPAPADCTFAANAFFTSAVAG